MFGIRLHNALLNPFLLNVAAVRDRDAVTDPGNKADGEQALYEAVTSPYYKKSGKMARTTRTGLRRRSLREYERVPGNRADKQRAVHNGCAAREKVMMAGPLTPTGERVQPLMAFLSRSSFSAPTHSLA